MYRIEFEDDGILRDCVTDNFYTAVTLFNLFMYGYPHIYMFKDNILEREHHRQ